MENHLKGTKNIEKIKQKQQVGYTILHNIVSYSTRVHLVVCIVMTAINPFMYATVK